MLTSSELAEHIRTHLDEDPAGIADHLVDLPDADVAEMLNNLTLAEAAAVLRLMTPHRAARVLTQPTMRRRSSIVEQLEPEFAGTALNLVPADQRTEIARGMSHDICRQMLPKLSDEARAEVDRLLQYPPRTAGGIMTTEFVRLTPAMTADEALRHIRTVARGRDTIYACYILEPGSGRLLGAVSLRDLIMAAPDTPIVDVMRKKPVTVRTVDEQIDVARKISKYNLLAVPVLEEDGRVVGFVTVDDVIDVLIEEQTKSVLRMGAVEPEALAGPYMETPFLVLVKKRAVWLVLLFLGEMLTATAMGFFEEEIAKAVVLALFVPLIISSGGNSGSQAATIIIRAMALQEVGLRDWWRIMRREILSGVTLGAILGTIGFLRIALWSAFSSIYGPHWVLVATTVGLSLVGIVTWGTLSGSMLPLILRRLGADPATSSAPFVATLVDVTGLVIYFSVAFLVLRGTLL